MYAISRIDDEKSRSHAWRVSLCRRGKRLVKNFPDKKYGGRDTALSSAKRHRDQLLLEHPPLSRKEFASAKRRHNRTGITGVCTFTKSWTLKDGTIRETRYWEANWPLAPGENAHVSFSVTRYGEDVARQMAIRAREEGLRRLEGLYWASERGQVDPQTRVADKSLASSAAQLWGRLG